MIVLILKYQYFLPVSLCQANKKNNCVSTNILEKIMVGRWILFYLDLGYTVPVQIWG